MLCNSLTSFEYEDHVMTGDGSYGNLLNLRGKIREIASGELFLAGLGHLEPPLSKKGRKTKRLHRSDKELLRGLKKQTLKSDNPSRL